MRDTQPTPEKQKKMKREMVDEAPASAELTLDEAIKAAQEWQENDELAIPAEIVTGLVDGALELKKALGDVRILLLPDSRHDMRPSMQSITFAKQRIRAALNPKD